MWDATTTIRRLRTVAAIGVYLLGSFLLLYPVLRTPVVADDLINPFTQSVDGGSTLRSGLAYSWHGSTEGASFRVVGGAVGAVYDWLWLTVSATFDVGMSTFYAATKFVVLLACASVIAQFWFLVAKKYGRAIRFRDALVLVSVALFGTLQIHGLWSNDPVVSYPLAGYGAAALGFALLSMAVVASGQTAWRPYVTGSAVAVVAVSYYEINIGAVIGSAAILLMGAWTQRAHRRNSMGVLLKGALFVGAPAAVVLYGRTVTAANSAVYAGTQARAAGSLRALVLGLGGLLPASAWRLSSRTLGGGWFRFSSLLIVVFVIACLARWWSLRPVEDEPGTRSVMTGPRAVAIAAVAGYGLFGVALQSITVKVQDETKQLGYVYTAYAMGSCVVALGVAILARFVLLRWRSNSTQYLVCAAALVFLVVQSTVNWRLSERMNVNYALNRSVLDAFDQDVSVKERCEAFSAWSEVPWPDYYRNDMRDGLQKAYEYYFGQPFCPAFPEVVR